MTQGETRLLIIDNDPSSVDEIKQFLDQAGGRFIFNRAESSVQAVDAIYSDPPDIILISQSLKGETWKDLCKTIKADTIFGYLPIVLILQPAQHDRPIDWEDVPADDYLEKPINPNELGTRISLNLMRTARVRDINPLTRLPGNYTIIKEIQERIDSGSLFTIGYVDLDNFKSFNDRYGFLRGDEVIKVTARLVTNSVRKLHTLDAFVGHIGGDDFVFIVPPDRLDDVCQEVIGNFDLIVGDFYDEGDRTRGYIESTNRKGQKEQFPIVPISIAVVTNEYRPIKHIGEVSSIAAEVKNRVKSMPGSNYVKDLRGSKCKVTSNL
jgi:diguanylate cyclase (GGDEF)-like protein